MAFSCTTEYLENGAVDQGARTSAVTFHGSYQVPFLGPSAFADFEYGATVFEHNAGTQEIPTPPNSNTYSGTVSVPSDKQQQWRATVFQEGAGTQRGAILGFKSYAVTATASAPTSSAVLANSATIACNYFPNTDASAAAVWLEYRKLGDSLWVQAGAQDANKQGYSQLSISRGLSGLLGSTTYEYRLSLTRTTSNATSFSSSISTFTTLPDAPSITTNAASSVASRSMTLNGTVDPNDVSGVEAYFAWGTADGGAVEGNWQNVTVHQPFSGGSPVAYSQGISGLNPSTLYFCRAFVFWP